MTNARPNIGRVAIGRDPGYEITGYEDLLGDEAASLLIRE
jgi:hypothetical protein